MRTIERGMVRMAHPTARPAIADLSGRTNRCDKEKGRYRDSGLEVRCMHQRLIQPT